MKIGDRVRLLRGTEEGTIVSIKGDKLVEVEIDDGFIIPALKNEVVVIDKKEAEEFQIEETNDPTFQQKRQKDHIPPGLYIGLSLIQGNQYQAYFINQLSDVVLYAISQNDRKTISGKAHGICNGFESVEIGELTTSIFNPSKKLNVQVIIYENKTQLKKNPLNIDLDLEKEKLTETVFLDSIDKEIFLIRIEEKQMAKIDVELIKEKLFESNDFPEINKESKTLLTEKTIDLHVDASSADLKSNEILEYQLNKFEKAYDNALLMNLKELKIIHGIGAGILRNEIHKRISAKKEVKSFEDSDKEKFGFGSTIIYF